MIEGRGNNDIIDGDHSLNVAITVRDPKNHAVELGRTDLMSNKAKTGTFGPGTDGMTLQQAVFAGLVNPGDLVAVREIDIPTASPTPDAKLAGDCPAASADGIVHLLATTKNCDTASYSLSFAVMDGDVVLATTGYYTVTKNADGSVTVADNASAAGVAAAKGLSGRDNVDTLWNIENLRFCTANDAVTKQCTAWQDISVDAAAALTAPEPIVSEPIASVSTGSLDFGARATRTPAATLPLLVTNMGLPTWSSAAGSSVD